jgi:MSHA biogenesis protein MshP
MFPDDVKRVTVSQQRGFGLPMALFVITVLAVIVTAMGSMQTTSGQSSVLHIQGERAFYAAESGTEAALNVLLPPDGSPGRACATSPFFSASFSASGLNDCSVSVSCAQMTVDGENLYTLTSQGSCGAGMDQASRTLEVRAR